MHPETRYARSGALSIAYQVLGEGPLDLVLVPGWVSNVEYAWEEPSLARFYRRLASFCRLILFDKRGTGLSDHVSGAPTLEERMDDVRAVMDAAGSSRAAVLGLSEGGPMSALFAATAPERVSSLLLYGTYARRLRADDYPWAPTAEQRERFLERISAEWGGPFGLEVLAPSMAQDEPFRRWWAAYLRRSASPGAALALARMNGGIDVRHVLPVIRVPTLVLHRKDDRDEPAEGSQYIAQRIAGARYVEFPGADHLIWTGGADAVLDTIQEFLTGTRGETEPDRVLATVLFTDIVGSTERAVELGDRRWRELLDTHHALVRRLLAQHRGREVKTVGDGFLATFDGPARAIRCAVRIQEGLLALGLHTRAGIHTGECELMGEDVGGVAVHIGARVASLAGAGEVLVSSTVRDLVSGSSIAFEDRGTRVLKGIPEQWRLYAVRAESLRGP
jgi:class 3 adenylate cyclase